MNILVIGRCIPNGRNSYGVFEMTQAKALTEAGHQVIYGYSDNRSVKVNRRIAFREGDFDGVSTCGSVVPVGGLPFSMVSWFKTRGLKKVLDSLAEKDFVPDVVYAHFPLLTLTEDFLDLLHERTIPLVCMEHWTKVQQREIHASRVALLKRAVASSEAFCCVSEDLRDSVMWYCEDANPSKFKVVPNIVDERVFYPADVSLRKRETPLLVSASRIVPNKRFDFLLEAFALAAIPRARLVIAGEGGGLRELQRLAAKLGVAERVEFPGWLSSNQLVTLLHDATAYVMASNVETFGVPLAEAWMCGLPCVAADCNPLRAKFSSWNGKLFATNDVSDLARCLEQVVNDSDDFESERISTWASGLYSKKAVVSQLEKLFDEAADA